MFIAKWYNVEMGIISAEIFKDFLRENAIRFESSGCFENVHFEIFVTTRNLFDKINNFLMFLP